MTPPPKWRYFFVGSLGKNTCYWFWKHVEEYGISYQYDVVIVKEKLQRLHALFSFDTDGHLNFDSQIAIGQTVAQQEVKYIELLSNGS